MCSNSLPYLLSFSTMARIRILSTITLILLLLSLPACVHSSKLPTPQISSDVHRLASLQKRPLKLHLSLGKDSQVLGYQYLFLVLPFGQVELTSPREYLERSLFRAFSQFGYRPSFFPPQLIEEADIILDIKNISLSAFDLLFLRKISSNVRIQARSTRKKHAPSLSVQSQSSKYAEYAFETELDSVLQETLSKAVRQLSQNRFHLIG